MKKIVWGEMPGGRQVELFTLENQNGISASISNYGATLISLFAPDHFGRSDNIVLGYEELSDYLEGSDYFGATIGRYANRIANGTFVLDGKLYSLPRNESQNTLHGGFGGFDKKLWEAFPRPTSDEKEAVDFEYRSHDGEEGFPGNLIVRVTYSLTWKNVLRIDYRAVSDRDTVLNLTNHSYFNLAGSLAKDVLEHKLTLNADRYLPVDSHLIPTGELVLVKDTPFDFRSGATIASRIKADYEQLRFGKGYDHTWVLNRENDQAITFAAKLFDNETKRVIEIWTTEPGIQFYSGNLLKPGAGRGRRRYHQYSGVCLETQHFPDSPNKPQFPSTLLKKNSQYASTTIIQL